MGGKIIANNKIGFITFMTAKPQCLQWNLTCCHIFC